MPEVVNRTPLAGGSWRLVKTVIERFHTIDQVASFSSSEPGRYSLKGGQAYDDFSHDVILTRSTDSFVFVFDVTCGGHIRSATIWDHAPSLSELSVARRERAERGDPSLSLSDLKSTCRFGGHLGVALRV